jgi:hypothetical protein
MPRDIKVLNVRDWTGGLNYRANQFTLQDNESPDLLNVDVDPRGGFRIRGGVEPWGPDTPGAAIHSLGQFHRLGATSQIFAGYGLNVKYSTGGAWSTIVTTQTVTTPFDYGQFNDTLYIQNGTDKPIKWTGSTATRLDQTYADDFDVPGSAKMPIAKHIAVYHRHMFVANTYESGTRYPHRIRWSHPNAPESWRSEDWVDVDPGVNGDEIVALVPTGDHLLVFKRKSVHIVMGFAWDSWQFDEVSHELGAVGPNAVVSTPWGVYFWSWPVGLCHYDGRSARPIGERLRPLVDERLMDDNDLQQVTLGYINDRVWCSIPMNGTPDETFVFDPSIGKSGAFTRYSLSMGPMLEWTPDADDHWGLGVLAGTGIIVKTDLVGQPYDIITVGGEHQEIVSYFTTPWFDAKQPAIRKRWRRPMTVYFAAGFGQVAVVVYKNYNSAERSKTFQETIGAETEGLTWDEDNWDEAIWAAEGADFSMSRGSPLGNAYSVQLKYEGPHEPVVWGVSSVSIPHIFRKVR